MDTVRIVTFSMFHRRISISLIITAFINIDAHGRVCSPEDNLQHIADNVVLHAVRSMTLVPYYYKYGGREIYYEKSPCAGYIFMTLVRGCRKICDICNDVSAFILSSFLQSERIGLLF